VEDAISGAFGGGEGQTIGTAPNSQERAVYEVDFPGGGEAGPGEGPGQRNGNYQLNQDAAVRHYKDQENQRRKLTPSDHQRNNQRPTLTPFQIRRQKQPPSVTQEAAVIQSKHDSRPSSALDDTSNADEHSIERDCHQSLAPNHHWTYDFLVSSDPEMMFPIVLMKARLKSYLMLHKL